LSELDIKTKAFKSIIQSFMNSSIDLINGNIELNKRIGQDFNSCEKDKKIIGTCSTFLRYYDYFHCDEYPFKETLRAYETLVDRYSHEPQRTSAYILEILKYNQGEAIKHFSHIGNSFKDVNIIEKFHNDSYFSYSEYVKIKNPMRETYAVMSLYIDYMEMRRKIYNLVTVKDEGKKLSDNELNRLLKSSRYIKPDSIKEEHDKAVKVFNNLKIEYNEQIFNIMKNPELNEEIDDYIIRVPHTANELAIEGAFLGNCVKYYIDKVITGETQICLLRPKNNLDTPNVVFEVRNGNLCQLEGKSRRRANQEESNILHKYIKKKKIKCSVILQPFKEKEKEEKIEA
jgi:hypothetical protein